MKNTRKHIAKIILTAVALLWTTTGICGADQLDNIKKTYSEVKTIEAQFSQKITISALKRQRELKGEFYYKRGKGFLWKYTTPKEKVFLFDGSAVWQAEEDKSYVVKEKMNKEKMEGNFLDLVDDVTHLDSHFLVKSSSKQDDMEVLQLIPKKEGGLQSARLWIDDKAFISKIELTEITGNVNIIDFSSTKINKPVSDTIFVFKPGNKQIEER
jgi:outer membrane lipoprotein carrier protein